MKTFEDLKFEPHPNTPYFSTQATMDFNNGYGISVATGKHAYTSDSEPYEIAILHKGAITYETSLTNNVLGYQTAENVTEVMKKAQELK